MKTMKKGLISIVILGVIVLIASCSKSVEQQSEKFIKYLNKQDVEKIKDLSISAFEEDIVANAKDFMKSLVKLKNLN